MEMKKLIAIGIIFLFVGVAVTPSINSSIVKTSTDNDLIEVTSQACGIQGFGNTTVKLTKEQYQNLEQYLVEFRIQLNQTTTKEDAIPIFKDAVVELNKYKLLPKGMSVERTQKLVIGEYQSSVLARRINKMFSSYDGNYDDDENYFCLIAGHTTVTITRGPILTLVSLSANHFYRSLQDWLIEHYNRFTMLFIYVVTSFLIPFFISLEIANSLSNLCPIMFLSTVGISCWSPMGPGGIAMPWFYPATGWLYSNGLNGLKSWSGYISGNLSNDTIDFGIYEFYPGILGFSGIKITLPFGNSFYLGAALEVKIEPS
jgi:hypothetical protein